MKDGLFPNMGSASDPAFNSVDAPLWFFWAVQQYMNMAALMHGKDMGTQQKQY
jgi:glycogen debranching enzyme